MKKENSFMAYPESYYNQYGKGDKMKKRKSGPTKCKGDDFKTAVSHTGKVEVNFTDPFACLDNKKGGNK